MCISIPAEVKAISGNAATVEIAGKMHDVLLAAAGVKVGNWVLIHSGIAVGTISETDALESRRLIDSLLDRPSTQSEDG